MPVIARHWPTSLRSILRSTEVFAWPERMSTAAWPTTPTTWITALIENVKASLFGDCITGNTADNSTQEKAGNDTLNGDAGSDTINPGAGINKINDLTATIDENFMFPADILACSTRELAAVFIGGSERLSVSARRETFGRSPTRGTETAT